MKRSKFSEEQIVYAIRQAEAGIARMQREVALDMAKVRSNKYRPHASADRLPLSLRHRCCV